MEIGRLTTVYDADDSGHRRVTDAVINRERRTVTAVEQLQRQRSAAIISQWKQAEKTLLSDRSQIGKGSSYTDQLIRDSQNAISAFQRTAAGAEAAVGGFGAKIALAEKEAASFTGQLGAMSAAAGPLAIVIGAVASAQLGLYAATFQAAKQWAEYGDSIFKAQQKTGQTAEQLSVIKFATEELKRSNAGASVSFDQVIRGIARFEANVSRGVTNPSRQAAKSLDALGLSAARLREMTPDEAFRTLMVRLDGVKNRMDRDRAASDLFGRDFQNLIPILDTLGKHFDQTQERARALGLEFSGKSAAQARQFMLSLKDAELAGKGLAVTFGAQVGPEITRVLRLLTAETTSWGSAVSLTGQLIGGMVRNEVNSAIALVALLKTAAEEARNLGSPNPADVGRGILGARDIYRKNVKEITDAMNAPLPEVSQGEHDVTFPGKSGESAARRAAKQALELARIDIAEAESVYGEGVNIARRAYDLNLSDFNDYVKRREDAERDRYEAVKKGFEAERRAAATLPTAGERAVELAKIGQRERDELRKHNETNAQLTTEGLQHRAQTEREFAELSVQFQQETNRVLELDLASQIERGTATAVRGWEARTEALGKEAEKQGEVLRLALVNALGGKDTEAAKKLSETISEVIGNAVNAADVEELAEGFKAIMGEAANPEAVRRALGQIQLFFIKRRQILREGNKDGEQSRAEDLRRAQEYANRLAEINDKILDAQFEVRQTGIDAGADNQFRRNATIEAQRVLEIARENARHIREVRGLEQRKELEQLNQNEKQRAAIIKAIDAEIVAEEQLTSARIVEIDRRANEDRRQQLVEVADDLAGIFSAGFEHIQDGWSGMWRAMLQEATNVLNQIAAELLKMSFEALLTGKTNGSGSGGLVGFLVNTIGGALLGGLGGGLPTSGITQSGILGSLPLSPNPRGYATGTMSALSGLAWVGERGPELIDFRGGERVYNNDDSRRLASGGNTYVTNNITLPQVPLRSYTQKRSMREFAETLEGLMSQRRR